MLFGFGNYREKGEWGRKDEKGIEGVKGGESVFEEHVGDWVGNVKKVWKRQEKHLWV